MAPLRVERHSGINYKPATTRFYSDVMLSDHIMVNARVIN
jgi:hypothetical protein